MQTIPKDAAFACVPLPNSSHDITILDSYEITVLQSVSLEHSIAAMLSCVI